jgi:CRISPR/Cas system-associated exonuclease Cas4 (RecB family)
MGVSLLGHPCDRYLWLNFRWSIQEAFPGRILRLFRRGHHEENWVISDLREAGIIVTETQRRVVFGSHVSGSLDGVVKIDRRNGVLEVKTHSKKSFDELAAKGVKDAKWQHYVQMVCYMHGTNMAYALYVAVCKDDDRLHIELIEADPETAVKYIERGKKLALAERMPPPISTDPSWWQCKFCPAYSFCHEKKPIKHANCRTCCHSTPQSNNTFHCAVWGDVIPEEYQHEGCDSHVIHPDLVPWEMRPRDDGRHVEWLIDGKWALNGPDGLKSREILANPSAVVSDEVAEVKALFPSAEVVG